MRTSVCFLAIALAISAQDGPSQRRLALVVGNDSYTALPRLANGRNDARAIAKALNDDGFQVTAIEDTRLEDMERAVNNFVAAIDSGDVALFYYSGHAVEIDGVNFLVPVDLDADFDAIRIRNRSMQAAEILERVKDRGAALQIVILDACRSNPFRGLRGSSSGGLAPMLISNARGTFIAYAAAPGQPAWDGSRGGNGLFTTYLLEALRKPGLEIERVFKEAGRDTEAASGGHQIPWTSSSVREDFYFRASVPGQSATAPSATSSANTQSLKESEIELGKMAQKANELNESLAAADRSMRATGGLPENLRKAWNAMNISVNRASEALRSGNIAEYRAASELARNSIRKIEEDLIR